MGRQKVCKLGRDNIKVKVNIQSPICTFFLQHLSIKEMVVYLHSLEYYLSLVCTLFWHAIP